MGKWCGGVAVPEPAEGWCGCWLLVTCCWFGQT